MRPQQKLVRRLFSLSRAFSHVLLLFGKKQKGDYNIEDGDQLDVLIEQVGGCIARK